MMITCAFVHSVSLENGTCPTLFLYLKMFIRCRWRQRCETLIDPCASNQCSTNSRCVSALGENERGYKCECNPLFSGELCEQKVSACKRLENPCNEKTEQGACVDETPDKHRCECSPLYTGANCEMLLNERCLNSDCNRFDPNATCIELTDRFYCRCSPGFEGPACVNIDDCKNSPCQNNATCIDGVNSFVCQCTEDFEGSFCFFLLCLVLITIYYTILYYTRIRI